IFRDYGYRKVRNRARLKFLVADWGIEKFRKVLEEDYLGRKLVDGPDPGEYPGYRHHIGIHEQKAGNGYVGAKSTVGHTDGAQPQQLADLGESYGLTRLRTTPDQEVLLLDVAPDKADALAADLEELGLSAHPSAFGRDIISCSGQEFC